MAREEEARDSGTALEDLQRFDLQRGPEPIVYLSQVVSCPCHCRCVAATEMLLISDKHSKMQSTKFRHSGAILQSFQDSQASRESCRGHGSGPFSNVRSATCTSGGRDCPLLERALDEWHRDRGSSSFAKPACKQALKVHRHTFRKVNSLRCAPSCRRIVL